MDRDEVAAHLEFFAELGVVGVRLEPEWRGRADSGGETTPVPATPVTRSPAEAAAVPPAPDVPPLSGAAPAALFASAADALAQRLQYSFRWRP
jgi:hypothetical protein